MPSDPPTSLAAQIAMRGRRRRSPLVCRHCEGTLSVDPHELLCSDCFTIFNQGVGVGRECQRRDHAEVDAQDRSLVADYLVWWARRDGSRGCTGVGEDVAAVTVSWDLGAQDAAERYEHQIRHPGRALGDRKWPARMVRTMCTERQALTEAE